MIGLKAGKFYGYSIAITEFESYYDRIERQNIFRETTKSNTFESYYDRIESILNVNKCLLAILLFLSEEEKAGKTITYSLTPRGRKAFT